jgi:hypothetical protein
VVGAATLSGRLLVEEFNKVQRQSDERLKESNNLTFNFDGWSNIHREDLLGASTMTPERVTYLLGAVELGGESHTGERLCGDNAGTGWRNGAFPLKCGCLV